MDAKDRLLLAYLQRNARMTAVELGERLNLSRSSVQARIARLEKSGVISGYTVVLRQKHSAESLRSLLLVTMEKEGDSARLLQRMSRFGLLHGISAVLFFAAALGALLLVLRFNRPAG